MLYALLLVAGAVAFAGQWIHGRIVALETRPIPPSVGLEAVQQLASSVASLLDRTGDLEDAIQSQNIAIAEGIERAERAERRVKSSVQRARRRLRDHGLEDDALEAEAASLRDGDGGGSGERGVPPVPADMAGAPNVDGALAFLKRAVPGSWTSEHASALLRR